MAAAEDDQRFVDINKVLTRVGPMALGETYGKLVDQPFDPSALPEGLTYLKFIREYARVLVVGAGGLGCELLKDLALMGFGNIDVIDMDTIDLSNLNRQFLFRKADVGRPKATVAAEFVARRVAGVTVTPHYCPIQDKDEDWYRQFQVIVMGLDSIEARRWLNAMVYGLIKFTTVDGERKPEMETVIPLVDGGTEGFKGHVRTIIPGISSCFECTLNSFPPQQAVPLCTIAETPRTAAHCILYAHLIQYPKEFPEDKPDKDDPVYQNWVYTRALERAQQSSIPGVTLMHTQGVIKNIIPAIASTNAVVAAACANEAFKLVTSCSTYMNNNLVYIGDGGLSAPTFCYDRNPECVVCGDSIVLSSTRNTTLTMLMEAMKEDARLQLKAPSISVEGGCKLDGNPAIYMRGVLEEHYKPNLDKLLAELFDSGATLNITDPGVPASLKVIVEFSDDVDVDVGDGA